MLATASPAGPGESRWGLRWSLTLQSAGQQRRLGFPSLEHKNPDFGTWHDADSIPRRTTSATHHRKPSMTSHSLHQQKSTTSASKPATHCRNQTTFNPSVARLPPGATHLPLGATHLSLGATHLSLGATHLSLGATHLLSGATHLLSGATHLLSGATHLPLRCHPPSPSVPPTFPPVPPTEVPTEVPLMPFLCRNTCPMEGNQESALGSLALMRPRVGGTGKSPPQKGRQ